MRVAFFLIAIILLSITRLNAKEGMWIPLLLEKYNIQEMQEMGFELSAKDVYDMNNASMKDAVVVFGSGCTGEMISEEGLLITNHHCGYRQIQAHSSIENDYLTNGFWAMNKEEELPNEGLTVRFLEYMEDVTDEVLEGTETLETLSREQRIKKNIAHIEKEAAESGTYFTQVKPLFYGNQYFLYVYKVFRDVRLVGAPPSAIGKFGGDTDNWMWPRHTGDFSLFRVYADKNNEPADFSTDNVPYKPKKIFPISLEGTDPGDFTMVLGNPGTTTQYIPSHEVDIILRQRNPDRVAIRDKKLKIIKADMESNPFVRIQYAAKSATISNAWKKWQGEIIGLNRLNAVNEKQNFEQEFKYWAVTNDSWDKKYREVFENFDSIYNAYQPIVKAADYYSEIVLRGVELFELAARINNIIISLNNNQKKIAEAQILATELYVPTFFRNYNQPTDEKLFEELLPVLYNDLDGEYLPEYLEDLMHNTGADKLVGKVYRKSVLCNRQELEKILREGNLKELAKLKNDPVVELYSRLNVQYRTAIRPALDSLTNLISLNMKTYMAGIMQMHEGIPLFPDANLTLRVAYGQVEGYQPRDGVKYKHFTTLDGIMQKDNPDNYDYNVPQQLRDFYETADYGIYKNSDGSLPVCFLSSNHTTGGNSGSPVVNAKGHLIGVNFDRVWESTMSDVMFDPAMSRNIAIDIRYALFIIDKFAGAGYLLEEMELVGVSAGEVNLSR